MFFLEESIARQYEQIEDKGRSHLFAKRSLIISTIFIVSMALLIAGGEAATTPLLAVLQLIVDVMGVLFGLWVIIVSATLIRYQFQMNVRALGIVAALYQLVAAGVFAAMVMERILPRWGF